MTDKDRQQFTVLANLESPINKQTRTMKSKIDCITTDYIIYTYKHKQTKTIQPKENITVFVLNLLLKTSMCQNFFLTAAILKGPFHVITSQSL